MDQSYGQRPSWMHQNEFVLCSCKNCFFCLNGYCNGIHNKPDTIINVYEVAGKKTKIKRCSDERVEIFPRSTYCLMSCCRRMEEIKMKGVSGKQFFTQN